MNIWIRINCLKLLDANVMVRMVREFREYQIPIFHRSLLSVLNHYWFRTWQRGLLSHEDLVDDGTENLSLRYCRIMHKPAARYKRLKASYAT
ncbi:hypothetical protein BBP40_010027 [Aspergillus hancockii]|nr:hypothetical protein BBP40_010027 [Aspergillus hancockii]